MRSNLGSSTHIETPYGKKKIKLINEFGLSIPCYPEYNDHLFNKIFDIKRYENILDIGGGVRPLSTANIVLEPYLFDDRHRVGEGKVSSNKVLYCSGFAESLPFKDKSFDFLFCRHVSEHVVKPDVALKEMMRVSKRGFIEVPSITNEFLLGYPSHQWLIRIVKDKLVFIRRPFVFHPLRNILRKGWYKDINNDILWNYQYRNFTHIQYYWENQIKYSVIDNNSGFDYKNNIHRYLSHLDFAYNCLSGDSDLFEKMKKHIEIALESYPDCPIAMNNLAYINSKTGEMSEAEKLLLSAFNTTKENSLKEKISKNIHNLRIGLPIKLIDIREHMKHNFNNVSNKIDNKDGRVKEYLLKEKDKIAYFDSIFKKDDVSFWLNKLSETTRKGEIYMPNAVLYLLNPNGYKWIGFISGNTLIIRKIEDYTRIEASIRKWVIDQDIDALSLRSYSDLLYEKYCWRGKIKYLVL